MFVVGKSKSFPFLFQSVIFLVVFVSPFFVLAAVTPTTPLTTQNRGPLIGFGIDRLRDHAYNKYPNNKYSSSSLSLDSNEKEEKIETKFFQDAILDNFAPVNKQKKWDSRGQRYFVNRKFYKGKDSPLFVMIGGEGPESPSSLSSKYYIHDLAAAHGAMLVTLEHRFYGESYPTKTMDNNSLEYLSSSQALADLARFITWFKDHEMHTSSQQEQATKEDDNVDEKIKNKSLQRKEKEKWKGKVITFGGSYPGNLSAWFRLKYPHITFGSIASSAPLKAKVDFYEYMEVVGESLKYFGGKECSLSIQNAIDYLGDLIARKEFKQIENDFQTCQPIESEEDVWVFGTNVMGNIQGTVQYNLEIPNVMNVSDVCQAMKNKKKVTGKEYASSSSSLSTATTDYEKFLDLNQLYFKQTGVSCMEVSYKDTLQTMKNITFDGTSNMRQWYYQTCNEFGYFQTTSSKNQPFRALTQLTTDSYLRICREVYDIEKDYPETAWINDQYGSLDISGTNIVFPSGTIDPWHALGITNSTGVAVPESKYNEDPLFILGTAHCADMHSPSENQPSSLTFAQEQIAKQVENWIKNKS